MQNERVGQATDTTEVVAKGSGTLQPGAAGAVVVVVCPELVEARDGVWAGGMATPLDPQAEAARATRTMPAHRRRRREATAARSPEVPVVGGAVGTGPL